MAKKKIESIDKKRIILIVVAIIAFIGSIVFIILTINRDDKEEEFKIEGIDFTENENILKDTKVDTLDITNQILYNRNEVSTFSAIIKNNNDTDYTIKELYAIFSINKETKKVLVAKNMTIKSQDEQIINISFDQDMLKTTKIEYELDK